MNSLMHRAAPLTRWIPLLALLACLAQAPVAVAQVTSLDEQACKEAATLAEPSIVRIETVGGLDLVGNLLTGAGPTTGVVVSEDGYIITSSFNFVSRPSTVLVTLPDGRRFPANIIATDDWKMLTLLKIEESGLIPIQSADKGGFRVGQWAIALGRTYDTPFPSMSVGIISAVNRIWGKAVQTDAKVSPVNYGGPLVDIVGRAIGILVPLSPQSSGETAGVEWYDGGIGFAIPMQDIYAALPRMQAGDSLKRGLIGVGFTDMGPLAMEARIDRVRPVSPADEAGLEVDDVIVEADGRTIRRVSDLQSVLGTKYAGDELTLAVRRGEETLDVTLTLADELVPWESPWLGILPDREPAGTPAAGVDVRYIYADSPAASAGIQRGDRIVAAAGQEITTDAELLDAITHLFPYDSLELTIEREGQTQTVSAALGTIPEAIPDDLATVSIPAPPVPDVPPEYATGRFTTTLPGSEQEYWAYVPEQYNPDYEYALVVWLHPGGDTMEAELLRLWQTECNRRGIILVGPKAARISGWTPGEADFITGVIEQIMQTYTIDPARVVLHGQADGGAMAFQTAFRNRELVTGIATIATPLRTPPPDNDPDFRQQFYLICGSDDALLPPVSQTAAGLKTLKFPVILDEVSDHGEGYPPAETIEHLVLWIDALDRL